MSVKFNDTLVKQIEEAAKDGVADASNLFYDETLRLIFDTQKSGRVYTGAWGGPTGTHQASAPEEPFANKTGTAAKSIIRESENNGLTEVITGTADYFPDLEFGNMTQAARPVFRPAIDNKHDEMVKAIGAAISKAL